MNGGRQLRVRSCAPSALRMLRKAKNGMSHAPYGYILGTDEKRTLQVNPETAPVVRRIFEMRACGMTPRKIADILNVEKVLTPNDYRIATTGINGVRNSSHLWHTTVLRTLLNNQAYIGNLVQHKSTTISYKNHKVATPPRRRMDPCRKRARGYHLERVVG